VALDDGFQLLFRCADSADVMTPSPFTVLDLLFDPRRDVFLDPREVYYDLRNPELVPRITDLPWWLVVTEAAQAISRYHYEVEVNFGRIPGPPPDVPIGYQRYVLQAVLLGRWPAKGLQLLLRSGLVAAWWPELAAMAEIAHTKDYHPEGDVWEHTLATFAHRKRPDLVLSLALLLHDVGKPHAVPSGEKRFFAHAEIGADLASRFLRRLGFGASVTGAVAFLARNHMMPAALKRLPPYRVEPLMGNQLFPRLLELYRADMLATFTSPEPYYEACRLYRLYTRGRNGGGAAAPQHPNRPRQSPRKRRYRR
jgi:poly(A) polymerase